MFLLCSGTKIFEVHTGNNNTLKCFRGFYGFSDEHPSEGVKHPKKTCKRHCFIDEQPAMTTARKPDYDPLCTIVLDLAFAKKQNDNRKYGRKMSWVSIICCAGPAKNGPNPPGYLCRGPLPDTRWPVPGNGVPG